MLWLDLEEKMEGKERGRGITHDGMWLDMFL
jgi:hypothetical protein